MTKKAKSQAGNVYVISRVKSVVKLNGMHLEKLEFWLSYFLSDCEVTETGAVYETRKQVTVVNGVKIAMYPRDHNKPHIHASYAGQEASYEIATKKPLSGSLGYKQDKIVEYFIERHQELLIEQWNSLRPGA